VGNRRGPVREPVALVVKAWETARHREGRDDDPGARVGEPSLSRARKQGCCAIVFGVAKGARTRGTLKRG